MTPFLKELAEKLIGEHPVLDHLTIIFPNRRAALYFQNYLSFSLKKPQWAPTLLSIEEFFKKRSTLREPDRLTLIFKLYQVYTAVLKNNEPFDRFYFWGEMLLRDFDELDKYMINAAQLFKDLSKLKELDETFDYLTEEQKAFLKEFWIHFEEKPSMTKDEFLKMWRKLPKVYAEYTKALKKEGLGYEGMIHREVASSIAKEPAGVTPEKPVIFAGFNAFTKAEEVLIGAMVEQGAEVIWDIDAYYTDNPLQEAGQFIRQYQKHRHFGKTLDFQAPGNLLNAKKSIHLTGVPQRIGQAKLAGELVDKILQDLPTENLPMELSKTVVVLPDESMLLPVMHSLPAELKDINVTMGFPLRHTPMFNLIDQIIEMQVKRRKEAFSHREVNAILGHTYFLSLAEHDAQELQLAIVRNNRVYVPITDLKGNDPVFDVIFKPVEATGATAYLLEVVQYLGVKFSDKNNFDREYAFHFHQHLSRLHEILSSSEKLNDWRGFQKLFRQVVLSQKIPFRGEPLRGLQIMGVLETRNLDFDNVIMLSVNEGLLPAGGRQGSYIPHSIRKAYGLPTFEHQDAIYAYLFYRLLQRASTVSFYYNTEPDVVGNGEMSRYLQQLLLESKLPIEKKVLHNPVHVHVIEPITVAKSPVVMDLLAQLINSPDNPPFKLSPSSLNDYIECRLRFYLRHIAKLKEADEVEEDVDARVFGNILHDVAHWFYEDLRTAKGGMVAREDLLNADERIERLIDRAFKKFYHLNDSEAMVYEGQRVVVKEVVKTFFEKIIENDLKHVPFEITMLEEPFSQDILLRDGRKVRIMGKIDRADQKNNVVRVIDYKTGKDDLNFDSIASLFIRDGKRNKAAFQTILYAYIYSQRPGNEANRIKPGLMNRKSLFGVEFEFGHKMGRERMENVKPYLPEFSSMLDELVDELFNPDVPFSQTPYEKTCSFCPYKAMCRR